MKSPGSVRLRTAKKKGKIMLKTLAEAIGISGNEDDVRELILSAIEDHVDEWRVDTMGNILALKKGTRKNQDIVPIDKMRLDIGVTSKDTARDAAPLGTYVAFDSRYTELSETTVRCKAFDDRAGCAELIALCQGEQLPFDLYAAFTVQEEIGLRGASVLGQAIQPDFAIILETTAC